MNNIETLHLHQIAKKLKQFYSSYCAIKKVIFGNTKILNIKYLKKYLYNLDKILHADSAYIAYKIVYKFQTNTIRSLH